MSTARHYDLYSHEFRLSTHETYARMRKETPVHRQPGLDGETPIWFVTRYDDVVALLTDNERFVVDPKLALTPEQLAAFEAAGPAPDERVSENLLAKDGDDHRRLRRLVTKAFTPRMVEQLRPRIQEIADDLIDRVAERGRMELVDDFAFPLPITVIAGLLGIPVEDRERFREWSSNVVTPALTPELQEVAARRADEFVAYLDDLFARRRAEPTDDLVSALVQAEDAGDTLSQNELYGMVVLLIVAGHETTVSLIANAVLALLSNPDELAKLRADRSLLPSAVEELVRYDSPVERTITRWAAVDVELGGAVDPAWRARHRGRRICEPRRVPVHRPRHPRSATRRAASMSGSGAARTSVSAQPSHVSRPRSRSRRCSSAFRTCASRSPRKISTGVRSRSSAASRRCRSPGTPSPRRAIRSPSSR